MSKELEVKKGENQDARKVIPWGKEESKSGLRVSNKMNNGATEHSKTQARKGPDVKRHLHVLVA